MDVSDVAHVPGVHSSSILRVEVSVTYIYYRIYNFFFGVELYSELVEGSHAHISYLSKSAGNFNNAVGPGLHAGL